MTETEKTENAIIFINCLANGVNPVTGEVLKESVFDEPEIIRCLFYVRDFLQKNGEPRVKKPKDKFVLTEKLALNDFLQDAPICLSPFARKIKDANNDIGPSPKKIWELLTEKGYLYEGTNFNGAVTRLPTEKGLQSGLNCVERFNSSGRHYYAVEYDRKGQELLWNCILELYS